LVADDNETNLFLASSIVEEYQGICDCAKNGEEVLSKIDSQSYDALLLDIQMPVMDGITALRKIRSNKKYSSLPVIALSAFSTGEEKTAALNAGANLYLSKPYFPEDLLDALDKILDLDQIVETEDKNDLKLSKSDFNADQIKNENSKQKDFDLNLTQINIRELEARILNKPENVLQINNIFHRRSSELINAISESIENEDFIKLRETAHSIKGLSGMLAADDVFELAQEVEKQAKNNNQQSLSDAAALIAKINEIEKDLEKICNHIKNS
jgi:CheY-like chemotaxis protein/HPt (histidine-containing phosphotransfer) domain-containing protein